MDAQKIESPVPLDLVNLSARAQKVARYLTDEYLDKQEIVRLLVISIIAGEHMLLVGPPGTAKSALIRTCSKLIDAKYFEYLLTRFTEPNEIFGPVDIKKYREGNYRRRTEGMFPEAQIVFLDEIFKSNSAILNSLLTILNERRFASGSEIKEVPLISVFGASNEIPNDENLEAMFDRFLLRVESKTLNSYHFHNLLGKGLDHEARELSRQKIEPILRATDLAGLHRS